MGPGSNRFPENGRRGESPAWAHVQTDSMKTEGGEGPQHGSRFKKDSMWKEGAWAQVQTDSMRKEGGEGPQHGSRTPGSKKIP